MNVTNITDALSPYFEGKMQFDDACDEAWKMFVDSYAAATFTCGVCGKIVYPKVITNEHGIFVVDERAEIRGGLGNRILFKDVCDECILKMQVTRD